MPTTEEFRELRDIRDRVEKQNERVVKLETQNKYLEDNYNQLKITSTLLIDAAKADLEREILDLKGTLRETRKTLFEERDARQLLDATFKRVMARYGGWAAGATAVGGLVGYALSWWSSGKPGAH